jgi:CheY-like chemotaxis protein
MAIVPFALASANHFVPQWRAKPCRVEDKKVQVPPSNEISKSAEPNHRAAAHPRVCVIDDEASVRNYCKYVLRMEGFHVDDAGDGVTGLQALRAKPYDLVLLDIELPQISGLNLLRDLRQSPPCADLKIMMVSGNRSREDLSQLLAIGADACLAKPFSPSELLCRVHALLHLE